MRSIFRNCIVGVASTILTFATAAAMAATVLTDSGGQSVQIQTSNGSNQIIHEGDQLPDGSRLSVPSGQAVTLATDTGMEVLVGQNTSLQTGHQSNVPIINLIKGEIRSYRAESASKIKKPRLRIETGDAVVGVRGTDFVVSASGSGTDVRTLDGVVLVANSNHDLDQNSGTSLRPGESIQGFHKGQKFNRVKFNPSTFLHEFLQLHPRMARLKLRAAAQRARFQAKISGHHEQMQNRPRNERRFKSRQRRIHRQFQRSMRRRHR